MTENAEPKGLIKNNISINWKLFANVKNSSLFWKFRSSFRYLNLTTRFSKFGPDFQYITMVVTHQAWTISRAKTWISSYALQLCSHWKIIVLTFFHERNIDTRVSKLFSTIQWKILNLSTKFKEICCENLLVFSEFPYSPHANILS